MLRDAGFGSKAKMLLMFFHTTLENSKKVVWHRNQSQANTLSKDFACSNFSNLHFLAVYWLFFLAVSIIPYLR